MNDDGTQLPDPRMIPAMRPRSWFDAQIEPTSFDNTGVDDTALDTEDGGRHTRYGSDDVAAPDSGGDTAADLAEGADPYDSTDPEEAAEPEGEGADGDSFVRPFIVTGGRTRPLHDGLRIETLVVSRPDALRASLHFEQRQIVRGCRTPLSLAEVAALVGVPIGVARVLVADLYTDNFVQLREPTGVSERTLERIRDLVRAL